MSERPLRRGLSRPIGAAVALLFAVLALLGVSGTAVASTGHLGPDGTGGLFIAVPGQSCPDVTLPPSGTQPPEGVCFEGGAGTTSGGGSDSLGGVRYAILIVVIVLGVGALGVALWVLAGSRRAATPPPDWWRCRTCGATNIAGIERCYSCGTWRPDAGGAVVTTPGRPRG